MDSSPADSRSNSPPTPGDSITYRTLFEIAQEGIWVIDENSNTVVVNPAMARMLGYTPEEMIGRQLWDFMDERGVEIAEGNVERRKQGISEQHDFEFMAKDGRRVRSVPGEGTTIEVVLPSAAEEAVEEDAERPERASGGNETILLAEDNADVRRMIERVLTDSGYPVIVATNGDEAVRMFSEHKEEVRLAILDVVMPVMGGRETLERIRALDPEVPALFVSGYPLDQENPTGELDPGERFLMKPFTPRQLVAAVREILDQPK